MIREKHANQAVFCGTVSTDSRQLSSEEKPYYTGTEYCSKICDHVLIPELKRISSGASDQVSSREQSKKDSKALCIAHAAADHHTFIVDARVLLRNYPVDIV